MRILSGFFLLIAAMVFINSCGTTSNNTVSLNFEATAEGPFFTGPNSLMCEYTVDLSNLVEGKEVNAEDIKKVNLISAQIDLSKNDSLNLTAFNSASLQFVSKNEPMTSFAVLNPIENQGNTTQLNVSSEADLAPYFKENSMTLVLDLELKEDAFTDHLTAEIKLDLNLEIKN